VRVRLGRDLVTHRLAAVSFYANNRDDALASGAPARHFPVHESNNGSGAYSATWLERQSYLPCGTPLLSNSAGCGDCSNKEQRTLCNGGTCMTKANSWRGHNTSLPPSPSQALASSLSRKKNQSRRRTFCVEVQRKKIRRAHRPKVRVQTGRFRPFSDRYLQVKRGLSFNNELHSVQLGTVSPA
jgi:hypothetical protein